MCHLSARLVGADVRLRRYRRLTVAARQRLADIRRLRHTDRDIAMRDRDCGDLRILTDDDRASACVDHHASRQIGLDEQIADFRHEANC